MVLEYNRAWESKGGGFDRVLRESRQPRLVRPITLEITLEEKQTPEPGIDRGGGKEMALDDEFAYHEALDRTHVLVCLFDDHILSHPVIDNDAELKAQAEKAEEALGDLYQLIGAKTDQKFPES